MNTAESQILSLLRTGDMVRMCLRPDTQRRVEVSIEGAPSEKGDGFLEDRLTIALGEIRSRYGFLFAQGDRVGAKKPVGASKRAKGRWVEICPLATDFTSARPESVGFSAVQAKKSSTTLRLPDFPTSVEGRIFESLSTLILDVREIQTFEVEFTRIAIPETAIKPLEEALRLHATANRATASGNDYASLTEAFLALWLSQRSGWRVVARAFLLVGPGIPTAALEMIGRDLFRCECEVMTPARECDAPEFDLSNSIPKGWPVPSILPTLQSPDRIAASRLHNPAIPNLPKTGLVIGMAEGVHVRLPEASRDRHTYIVGATGTGKSTLMERMIIEDMRRGEGVVLLDPHGDLYAEVRAAVPKARLADVIEIDPLSGAKPPGINFLDVGDSPRPAWRLRFMIGELMQFFGGVWDMHMCGGPMFEMYFRNAFLLLGDQGVREKSCHTLLNFASLLSEKEFRDRQLEHCRNEEVKNFWKNIAEKAGSDASLANIVPYIVSKMDLLTQSSFIREMIGRPKDTLRMGERMDRRAIVLCNLSKGVLGALESRLLGAMLMSQIFAAGLERGMQRRTHRRPVNIYVDEFQNFVSDNVASMLSEARKFGLRLTLANQTLGQLKANTGKQDLLETVLGNVGNIILFRLGVPDADRLKLFLNPFTQKEMQELPNFHALVRLLTDQGPVKPLIMQTLPNAPAKPRPACRKAVEKQNK